MKVLEYHGEVNHQMFAGGRLSMSGDSTPHYELHETTTELPPLFNNDEAFIAHATDEYFCEGPYGCWLDSRLHEPRAEGPGYFFASLSHCRVV